MVRVGVAPCSPFSVSRELMRDAALLARDKSVFLHTFGRKRRRHRIFIGKIWMSRANMQKTWGGRVMMYGMHIALS